MLNLKENIFNKKMLIISAIALILIILIVLYAFLFHSSNEDLNLSNFEKIAIYGYLEDYLSLDQLYLISGNAPYDDLQYTQSKIKKILDAHYENNGETTISANTILSELETDGISNSTIDFRSIVVSDYEYLPEENSFVRAEGANKGLSSTESQPESIVNDYKLSVTDIKKVSEDSYDVYFDVTDSNSSENTVLKSGIATIDVVDNQYVLKNCTF